MSSAEAEVRQSLLKAVKKEVSSFAVCVLKNANQYHSHNLLNASVQC